MKCSTKFFYWNVHLHVENNRWSFYYPRTPLNMLFLFLKMGIFGPFYIVRWGCIPNTTQNLVNFHNSAPEWFRVIERHSAMALRSSSMALQSSSITPRSSSITSRCFQVIRSFRTGLPQNGCCRSSSIFGRWWKTTFTSLGFPWSTLIFPSRFLTLRSF